jgi:hypothetical protein
MTKSQSETIQHRWVHNFKNVALQKQTQFLNQERNTQNAIALLNYLKRIALQQSMLRTQVFIQIYIKRNFLK